MRAAKVTGSLGNYEIGVMDVSTRESGPNPSANYLVGRVKRSLWGGSYIGAMAIDKTSGNPGDSYNQTEGVDTRLVFWRNLVVRGYAAQTRTPGISSGQTDLGASANYNTNWLELFGGTPQDRCQLQSRSWLLRAQQLSLRFCRNQPKAASPARAECAS